MSVNMFVTSIHVSKEDLKECVVLNSGAICIDFEGENVPTIFLRTPAAALHLAHLLRVAAGAEEPRTSEASDASA